MSANFSHMAITGAQKTIASEARQLLSKPQLCFKQPFDRFVSRAKTGVTAPGEPQLKRLNRYIRSVLDLKPQASDLPRSPYKISADERILPGHIQAFGTHTTEDFLAPTPVLRPFTTFEATGIKVNVRRDKHLKAFLKSPQLLALRKEIPTKHATLAEEDAFANQVNQICGAQFDHKGFTPEELVQSHFEDTILAFEAKLDDWINNGKKGPPPRFHKKTRLLGDSMKAGKGVCVHKALLNKLILDGLAHPDLQTTLLTGLIKNNPTMKGKFLHNSQGHVWTELTMPSGRTFRLDPGMKVVIPLTQKLENGSFQEIIYPIPALENYKNAYVSHEHLLKHQNAYLSDI